MLGHRHITHFGLNIRTWAPTQHSPRNAWYNLLSWFTSFIFLTWLQAINIDWLKFKGPLKTIWSNTALKTQSSPSAVSCRAQDEGFPQKVGENSNNNLTSQIKVQFSLKCEKHFLSQSAAQRGMHIHTWKKGTALSPHMGEHPSDIALHGHSSRLLNGKTQKLSKRTSPKPWQMKDLSLSLPGAS